MAHLHRKDLKALLTLQAEVFELVSLGVCDVAGLLSEVLGRKLQVGLPGGHRGHDLVIGSDLLQGPSERLVGRGCGHGTHRGIEVEVGTWNGVDSSLETGKDAFTFNSDIILRQN